MEEKPRPTTESLIYEARAKITWGEPAAEVREWLLEQGLDTMRVDEVLQACIAERGSAVRKRAFIEIMAGAGLLLVPSAVILAMFLSPIRIRNLFAFCVVVGLYGLFRLLRGLGWMMSGANYHGSLSDMGDGWL